MRCLSCDYELSHLTEHRCPECGRLFDPAQPGTYDDPHADDPDALFPRGRVRYVLVGLATVFAVAMGLALSPDPELGLVLFPMFAAIAWPFAFACLLGAYGIIRIAWNMSRNLFRA